MIYTHDKEYKTYTSPWFLACPLPSRFLFPFHNTPEAVLYTPSQFCRLFCGTEPGTREFACSFQMVERRLRNVSLSHDLYVPCKRNAPQMWTTYIMIWWLIARSSGEAAAMSVRNMSCWHPAALPEGHLAGIRFRIHPSGSACVQGTDVLKITSYNNNNII